MMIKAKRRFQNTSNTASLRLPLTKRFLTHGQEWKAEPVHATRHSSRLGAKQLALIALRKHFWPAPHLGSKTFCSPSANTCMILCMGWLPMVCWPGLPFFWSRHDLIMVRWTSGSSFMDLWHCGCTQRKARLLCTGSLTPKLLNLTRKLENSSAQQVKCWVFVSFWRIMWNYAAFPMDYALQLVNVSWLGAKCWTIVWQFLHCKGLATNTCFNWLNKHWLLPSMQVGHRSSDQRCTGLCISVMLWSSMVNFLGFGLWKGNTRTPGNMQIYFATHQPMKILCLLQWLLSTSIHWKHIWNVSEMGISWEMSESQPRRWWTLFKAVACYLLVATACVLPHAECLLELPSQMGMWCIYNQHPPCLSVLAKSIASCNFPLGRSPLWRSTLLETWHYPHWCPSGMCPPQDRWHLYLWKKVFAQWPIQVPKAMSLVSPHHICWPLNEKKIPCGNMCHEDVLGFLSRVFVLSFYLVPVCAK